MLERINNMRFNPLIVQWSGQMPYTHPMGVQIPLSGLGDLILWTGLS